MGDLKVLEKILVKKGRVVDYEDLSTEYKHLSNIAQKISILIKKGLLTKLKKGKYYISKLGSLGYTSMSSYALANIIGEDSFVSFEAALKYHSMFDQGLKTIRSISKKQYLDKTIEEIKYEYIKVKETSYFGYKNVKVDGGTARIATKERALLDLIEYQRTVHSVSLVMEKLGNYIEEIDYTILLGYLHKCSQVTIKIIGLIFDFLNLDSAGIRLKLNSTRSTHKLLESSDKFNDKWRIYYDSILDQQSR